MKSGREAIRSRRLFLLVSGAAILLFLLLAARQAAKPLHLDAMDFPAVAKATAETGRPIYYRGEGNPEHNGLFHPPLYIYLLAAWFKLFGSGAAAARMFGAASVLVFGWTTLLLGRALLTPEERSGLGLWFWPLFLLNPFTLQCSAIPDIDTTIYGPLLTLLLWSVLRLSWRNGSPLEAPAATSGLSLVAALFALCLWAKLTTVLAFLPLLFLLAPKQRGWKRSAATTAIVLAAGAGLFLLTYLAYGGLVHLDVLYTWQFLKQSFSGRGHLPNPLANLALMGMHLLRWTGPLPWAAFGLLLGAASVFALRRREERARPLVVILLLHGGITVYYCARTLTFGNAPFKYVFVSFGVVSAALAYLAWSLGSRPSLADLEKRPAAPRQARWTGFARYAPAALGAALGLIVGAVTVRDAAIQRGWFGRETLVLLLPAALAALGLSLLLPPERISRAYREGLILSALGLHLGIQGGTAYHQAQAEYSTTYDYGQDGLADAAKFVQQRTGPDDLVSSMKDLGFLAERRYVEDYSAMYSPDEARLLLEYWESGRVRFIVFTEGIGHDQVVRQPLLRDWIGENADLVASFGNYRIYQPRVEAQRSAHSPPALR